MSCTSEFGESGGVAGDIIRRRKLTKTVKGDVVDLASEARRRVNAIRFAGAT